MSSEVLQYGSVASMAASDHGSLNVFDKSAVGRSYPNVGTSSQPYLIMPDIGLDIETLE